MSFTTSLDAYDDDDDDHVWNNQISQMNICFNT